MTSLLDTNFLQTVDLKKESPHKKCKSSISYSYVSIKINAKKASTNYWRCRVCVFEVNRY